MISDHARSYVIIDHIGVLMINSIIIYVHSVRSVLSSQCLDFFGCVYAPFPITVRVFVFSFIVGQMLCLREVQGQHVCDIGDICS